LGIFSIGSLWTVVSRSRLGTKVVSTGGRSRSRGTPIRRDPIADQEKAGAERAETGAERVDAVDLRVAEGDLVRLLRYDTDRQGDRGHHQKRRHEQRQGRDDEVRHEPRWTMVADEADEL
jgi:hypothetical protein